MKTLVFLVLVAFQLCHILNVSSGFTFKKDTFGPDKLKLKAFIEKAITDRLMKKNDTLKNIESIINAKKMFGKAFAEKTRRMSPSLNDTNFNLNCTLTGMSLNCCELTDTIQTCSVVEFGIDVMDVSYQIDGAIIWKRTVSYGRSVGSLLRALPILNARNMAFPKDSAEDETKEEVSDESSEEDEDEKAATVKRSLSDEINVADNGDTEASCSWQGNVGSCCADVFQSNELHACFLMQNFTNYMELNFTINKAIVWRENVDHHATRIYFVRGQLFFKFYNLSISRNYFRVCSIMINNLTHTKTYFGCISWRLGFNGPSQSSRIGSG